MFFLVSSGYFKASTISNSFYIRCVETITIVFRINYGIINYFRLLSLYFSGNFSIINIIRKADVAKLVDALDLGSSE